MDIKDILELTKAGFTKEEIIALCSTEEDNAPKEEQNILIEEQPKTQPTQTETQKQTQKQTQNEQTKKVAPLLTDAQVKQLAQALNVGKASIDVPPTLTVEDQMAEHYKNLLLGTL